MTVQNVNNSTAKDIKKLQESVLEDRLHRPINFMTQLLMKHPKLQEKGL